MTSYNELTASYCFNAMEEDPSRAEFSVDFNGKKYTCGMFIKTPNKLTILALESGELNLAVFDEFDRSNDSLTFQVELPSGTRYPEVSAYWPESGVDYRSDIYVIGDSTVVKMEFDI